MGGGSEGQAQVGTMSLIKLLIPETTTKKGTLFSVQSTYTCCQERLPHQGMATSPSTLSEVGTRESPRVGRASIADRLCPSASQRAVPSPPRQVYAFRLGWWEDDSNVNTCATTGRLWCTQRCVGTNVFPTPHQNL